MAGNGGLIKINNNGSVLTGTLGIAVTAGQPVYENTTTGLWYLAQATTTQITNLSVATNSGVPGQMINFIRFGNLTNVIGLPINSEIYLSQTIAGGFITTIPTTGVVAYIGSTKTSNQLDVAIGEIAFLQGAGGGSGGTGSGGPRWSYVLGGM